MQAARPDFSPFEECDVCRGRCRAVEVAGVAAESRPSLWPVTSLAAARAKKAAHELLLACPRETLTQAHIVASKVSRIADYELGDEAWATDGIPNLLVVHRLLDGILPTLRAVADDEARDVALNAHASLVNALRPWSQDVENG